MGLPKLKVEPSYTLEQYLDWEREAEQRSEYIDGEIYQMAGESGAHADICTNLTMIVASQLRGKPCRARSKDTKVKSGAIENRLGKGMICYPDLVVICGEPRYHDRYRDVVLNPGAIVEVLSDSTAAFDRGVKFTRYRMFNDTLTDYVLISQDEPHVEHYIRQENGDWLLREFYGLDKNFRLDSIDCSLALSEIYDRVEFAEQ